MAHDGSSIVFRIDATMRAKRISNPLLGRLRRRKLLSLWPRRGLFLGGRRDRTALHCTATNTCGNKTNSWFAILSRYFGEQSRLWSCKLSLFPSHRTVAARVHLMLVVMAGPGGGVEGIAGYSACAMGGSTQPKDVSRLLFPSDVHSVQESHSVTIIVFALCPLFHGEIVSGRLAS